MDKHEIVVKVGPQDYTTKIEVRDHVMLGDEPESIGGKNAGPNPYEMLLAALGSCTAMTIRMYANHKKWPVEGVTVHLTQYKDYAEDCVNCEDPKARIDFITKRLEFKGDLSEEQIARLMQIADRCPVHKTLSREIRISSERVGVDSKAV